MRRQRGSEIAFEHLSDVVGVLHRQGPIKSELVQQARAARGIHAALARQVLDRIAGNQMNQRERQQRHADERGHDQRDATQDEADHESRYPNALLNAASGSGAQCDGS